MPPASRGSSKPTAPVGLSIEQFTELFERSFHVFWLVAVAVLGDRHTAEDAVQEAAMRALNKLDAFTPGTSFTAWMGQIVRYVALNDRRKRARRQTTSLHECVEDPLASPDTTRPAEPLDWSKPLTTDQRLFDDRLTQALTMLEPNARACLLLRVVGEQGYDRIAEVLDIPTGTAMSHVHRSRKRLREALQAPFDPESAASS